MWNAYLFVRSIYIDFIQSSDEIWGEGEGSIRSLLFERALWYALDKKIGDDIVTPYIIKNIKSYIDNCVR